MMKSQTICVVALSLALTFAVRAEVVDAIRENVRDSWRKIADRCQDVQELVDELPSLPDSAWFSNDKKSQLEKIRKCQIRIREELLSVDTRVVLEKAEKLGRKIADRRQHVVELKEQRGFAKPETQKKIDQEVQEEQEKIQRLAAQQNAEMAKVKKELAAIGLHAKDGSMGALLSMANRADIIDNAIVARGICEVLNGLRGALKEGDAISAKRYYGVYLVLTDVHILCFEQYLEKSRYGEWRAGLNRLEANANGSIERAEAAIASGDYEDVQCGIFRRTIGDNRKLLGGVQLYRKLLDAHEAAVEGKLVKVRKQRNVVQSLYETVSGKIGFADMLQSVEDDYVTVMELELPDLAVVGDTVTEDQINVISKMLDMN